MPFVFLHDMQIKWHWDFIRSNLRVSLTDPLQGSWRAFSHGEQVGGEKKRFLRILNGRSQPLERAVLSLSNDSFASFRLRRQPTGLTFGSLPATSIVAENLAGTLRLSARFGKESRAHRGRNSRLAHRARQDSLRSLSASQDNPLGYRFLRSSGKAKKPDRLIRLFCTARAETLLLEKRYAIIAE